MTGEMSRDMVTREEYPLHFSIARALRGTVEPFDVYQGPYILAPGAKLFICPPENDNDSGLAVVWNDRTRTASAPFWPYGPGAGRRACRAARSVTEA